MEYDESKPEVLLGPLNDVEKKNAPKAFFISGDPEILNNGARVSLVGSRAASSEGIARARKLAKILVQNGHVVVSGLAKGVDTAAHKSAIDSGGKTIAVLGTPLNAFYPSENRALQTEIMRNHLCVSQFAQGTTTHRGNFPTRNRTMALLSDATVIIEAKNKSGSLHQGWEALRLGRGLFIMKSVVDDPESTWTTEMYALLWSMDIQILGRTASSMTKVGNGSSKQSRQPPHSLIIFLFPFTSQHFHDLDI